MVQMNYLNLPAVYGAAEQVKGMRMQNQLAQRGLERSERTNALMGPALSGDTEALNRLAQVDTGAATDVQKFLANASEQEMAQARANLEGIARLVVSVESAPPAQRPQAYQRALQQAKAMGLDVSQAPPNYDPQFTRMIAMQVMDLSKMLGPQEVYDPNSPTQTRFAYGGAAVGQPGKPRQKGMELSVGPEGDVKFSQGGYDVAPGAGLSKPTQNAVEATALASSEGLARLDAIQQSFRPEFQELGTRFGAAWTAGKEKLGFEVSEQDRQALTDFTTFKRYALSNLNQYIKEITGAALSEAEARRIRAAAPDPGEGIFDGDSPSEFQAKMAATINELELANARAIYAARNGLNALDVNLNNMKTIINQRYNSLISEYELTGRSSEEAKALAQQKIKEEFGI